MRDPDKFTVRVAVPSKLDTTARTTPEAYRDANVGTDGADPRAHVHAATGVGS